MSVRRMSLGAGYRYLMSSVARADLDHEASGLTKYYAESGTPPGRFLGAGLAGLADGSGVAPGAVVSEEALFRMLGMLQDPVTGRQLGRAPSASAVAGFDLTFSAPKSMSVLWAFAEDETREAILGAHHRSLQQVIAHAESHVFASRIGVNGVVTIPVRGVVAAAFGHWDSRAGDPQLHTHVVVLNRVQGFDGVWRTLDSKALFAQAVELSELYNGLLADHLTNTLGVSWIPETRLHSDVPKWEIDGIPTALRDEFSQRSKDIAASKDDLIAQFQQTHGRLPTSDEVLKLRQKATLETRPDKTHRNLHDLTGEWRTRAASSGFDPAATVAAALNGNALPLQNKEDLDPVLLEKLGQQALAAVADKRATFTTSNVSAEVLRQLHGIRLTDPGDRIVLAESITNTALESALLLRPEGTQPNRLTRGRDRFTTPAIMDAETRIIDLADDVSAPTATPNPTVDDPLSPDQAAAVEDIATSGRTVDLLVGPAGAGKTTTLAALRQRWEASHGPGSVLGLAPSAAAAQVLSDELGIPTDNTAKWLTETHQNSARGEQLHRCEQLLREHQHPLAQRRITLHAQAIRGEIDRWSIRPNQLVIIDEASLAGTLTLDQITQQTTSAGAKLLLVGDPAQLGAVQAGGIFAHLAATRPAPHLTEIHRFHHEWEKQATQRLRNADSTVIADYISHDRVHEGQRSDLLQTMLQAWIADTRSGLTSLMITADNDTASHLNRLARERLVNHGEIANEGVQLRDGTIAGVGDLVVTRRNDRTRHTGREWVKNGDTWTVSSIHEDGGLTLQRNDTTGEVRLDSDYVRRHLDLGYAATLHRVQGRTSDTAHAYITPATQHSQLYVAATRGREANHLYVDTGWDPDPDTRHNPAAPTDVSRMLTDIINRPVEDTRAASSFLETSISAVETRPTEPRSPNPRDFSNSADRTVVG